MFYLTAKFQKNWMNGLEGISERTYARTHGRDSLGLQRLRRETKKLANSNERIGKKCKKPPFLGILGQNGQFWTVFWPKWGQNGNFFQKSAWNISGAYPSST